MRPSVHPPANTHKLGLLVFGIALATLFTVLALTGGVGNPTVPSGAVAIVEDTPMGTVEITKDQFEHSFDLVAVANGIDPPVPGDFKYQGVRNAALEGLIEAIWIPAQGEAMGFTQSEQELENEVDKLKRKYESTGYTKYLPAGFRLRQADFEREARQQAFKGKIDAWLNENVPIPSQTEIETYYQVQSSEGTVSLKDFEEEIKHRLKPRLKQELFADFGTDFNEEWRSRTFCAPGFVVERCENFASDVHPADAPPSCYEPDPKEEPEACPASVLQPRPALPGSISPWAPSGQQLAQRPRPGPESRGEGTAQGDSTFGLP